MGFPYNVGSCDSSLDKLRRSYYEEKTCRPDRVAARRRHAYQLRGASSPRPAAAPTTAPEAAAPTAAPTQPKSDVTLSIATSANWSKDIDKTQADQFTKETGIKVEFQPTPDDQYSNVLKAKLSTGEGPEISWSHPALV